MLITPPSCVLQITLSSPSAPETPLQGPVFFPAIPASTAALITLLGPLLLPDVPSVFTGPLTFHLSSVFAGTHLSHRARHVESLTPRFFSHLTSGHQGPWNVSIRVSLIPPPFSALPVAYL